MMHETAQLMSEKAQLTSETAETVNEVMPTAEVMVETKIEATPSTLPPPETETKSKKKKRTDTSETAVLTPTELKTIAEAEAKWEWEWLPEDLTKDAELKTIALLLPPDSIIIAPFDARAKKCVIPDDFQKSISANGVETPVIVTPIRLKADPTQLRFALVAGRRRIQASIKANIAFVQGKLRYVKNWAEALTIAATENIHRAAMTNWDYVSLCKQYLDLGYNQSQIANVLNLSDAAISKFAQVLDMDSRIRLLVENGRLDTTKTREIARLRDPSSNDMLHDAQYDLALKVMEQGWRSEDIRTEVEGMKQRLAQKMKEPPKSRTKKREGEEEEVPKREPEKYKFDRASIAQLKKVEAHLTIEWANKTLQILRKKNAPIEKLKFQEGVVEGMRYQLGLKPLPSIVLAEEE